MKKSMILSSFHTIDKSNTTKLSTYHIFINEYRRVAHLILNEIWDNGYKEFNINDNKLDLEKYIDYKYFNIDTILSARALSSLITQLSGIIKTVTEKQRKRIYILNKKKQEGMSKNKLKGLIINLKNHIPHKPDISNINPELSSKCIEYIESDTTFNAFIKIKSIMSDVKPIYIPIKFHKHSNSLKEIGTRLNSFLLRNKGIDIRWNIETPKIKESGITVGADQGLLTVLTLSDTQTTNETCIHGHSLKSILQKMCRQKQGSKAFKRSQSHRTNFINASINKLDFSGIKQINLERIFNIGYKSPSSRLLSHWTNTTIRDKVQSKAIRDGVHLIEQDSTYRSQRCSCCGMVRKSNRKGKTYSCNSCGYIGDADMNAAKNHEISLPEIPYKLRISKLNRTGFYWIKTGFFDLLGTSLESVPHVEDIL